ncbi:MAG: hypothetical protein KAK00_00125 [Nanoarchaeota archaeon]|nr:hypothetical protein [Nanoarchaeota archaeon]
MAENIDDIIEKASSPDIAKNAGKAKASLKFREHYRILKHYNMQKGGKGKFDFEELADKFEKDNYKLEPEFAERANHELIAHGLTKAINAIGTEYKKVLDKYTKEKDPEKRAELQKQLDSYREIGHNKLGIHPEQLKGMKKSGYHPDKVDSLYHKMDEAIAELNRKALLDQIGEEDAYMNAEKLAGRFKFNKTAVRSMGANKAREILLQHHQVTKLYKKPDQVKAFKDIYKDTELYMGEEKKAA